MTAAVDLVNEALGEIAAKSTITNLQLENSAEARLGRQFYATTRDALLRAAHWNFCKVDAYLSMLKAAPGTPENPTAAAAWDPATMPVRPWMYEYAYPSDCLLVRYVTVGEGYAANYTVPIFTTQLPVTNRGDGAPKFKWEAASSKDAENNRVNVINTNVRTAVACYTVRVENEDLWDPLFRQSMIYSLATRFAMPLTGKLSIRQAMAAQATASLQTARSRDGNEGVTTVNHTPDWLMARGVPQEWLASGGGITPWVEPAFLGS